MRYGCMALLVRCLIQEDYIRWRACSALTPFPLNKGKALASVVASDHNSFTYFLRTPYLRYADGWLIVYRQPYACESDGAHLV